MDKTVSGDIQHLNSFLRGEISAVQTYDQAIQKLRDEPSLSGRLEDLRQSHEQRAEILRSEIVRRGGEPAEGSGMWGSFA